MKGYHVKEYTNEAKASNEYKRTSNKNNYIDEFNNRKIINEYIACQLLKALSISTPETKIISGKKNRKEIFGFASKKPEGDYWQPPLEEMITTAKKDSEVAFQFGLLMSVCDILFDTDVIGPKEKANILFQKNSKKILVIKFNLGEAQIFEDHPVNQPFSRKSLYNVCIDTGLTSDAPGITNNTLKSTYPTAIYNHQFHTELKSNPNYQNGLKEGYDRFINFPKEKIDKIIDDVKNEAFKMQLFYKGQIEDIPLYDAAKQTIKERIDIQCLKQQYRKNSAHSSQFKILENLEKDFKSLLSSANKEKNNIKILHALTPWIKKNPETIHLTNKELAKIKSFKKRYYRSINDIITKHQYDKISLKRIISSSNLLKFNRTRYLKFVKKTTSTQKQINRLLP